MATATMQQKLNVPPADLAIELQQVQHIQETLVPSKIPQVRGYDVCGMWRPAGIVSGDYFDVVKLRGAGTISWTNP